jgi:uroporphyrinogen decarboxylase
MAEFDFIKAAYGLPHDRVPIWIMRQAGRYLPEFRAVRDKASFMEICRSPELMAEVTQQPIDIFGMDAAIMFSDILLPLEPMGIKVSYDNGGPSLTPPVRTPDDVASLTGYDPSEEMAYALSGIKEIKDRLEDIVPLIGFCGSPFTLATYLVEGGGTWRFTEIKKFIYNHPEAAARLLGQLAELTGQYLKEQVNAGVDAIQLFDSWGGILPPDAYEEFSLRYIRTVFEICRMDGIPRILYLNNTAPYLKMVADLDCEVIGIDWRTDLDDAMNILDGKTIQGNLDPQLLMGPGDLVYDETVKILEAAAHRKNFIFNLGHGIQPEATVDNVKLVVDTVHSYKIGDEKGASH